jgi:heme exporter protein C
MPVLTGRLKLLYWLVTLAVLAGAGLMLALYTPVEETMGPIQKIFYVHLPMAINTLLSCGVVFVGSVGFLLRRQLWWDDLASAAARTAVILGFGVLATGMIWAHSAWGVWWTWSPRLTFTLILWLLYLVYVLIRPSIESADRRALVSAVYGIVAFLDVPLVYLTAWLMPQDIHPTSVQMTGSMKLTLAVWFLPITFITGGLLLALYNVNKRTRARRIAGNREVRPVAGGQSADGLA